jgi:hypothetical protein
MAESRIGEIRLHGNPGLRRNGHSYLWKPQSERATSGIYSKDKGLIITMIEIAKPFEALRADRLCDFFL